MGSLVDLSGARDCAARQVGWLFSCCVVQLLALKRFSGHLRTHTLALHALQSRRAGSKRAPCRFPCILLTYLSQNNTKHAVLHRSPQACWTQ